LIRKAIAVTQNRYWIFGLNTTCQPGKRNPLSGELYRPEWFSFFNHRHSLNIGVSMAFPNYWLQGRQFFFRFQTVEG